MPHTCETVTRAICPPTEPQVPWSAGSECPVPGALAGYTAGEGRLTKAHSSIMPLSPGQSRKQVVRGNMGS